MEQNVDVPRWINKNFLINAMKESYFKEGKTVLVKSFTIAPAVAPGNNYLSKIYRVRVKLEDGVSIVNGSISLIVKVPFEEGFMKELHESHNVYAREPKVYGELLPTLYNKLNVSFGPKSLYCTEKNALVMEDLKEKGFVVCDKIKQLDYLHCKAVIEKLAKFHAGSVSYFQDNPDLINTIGKELYWKEDFPIKNAVQTAVENLVKTARCIEGQEVFADHLKKRVNMVWTLGINMSKPKLVGLNVLNHGDMWTNNVLFRYNKLAEIVDVKFIDYQGTKFASPAYDLVYFIWTSANEDVRGKQQQDLFQIYLQTLNTTLEELGCVERLSHEELAQDLKMAADWVLLVVAFLLPHMIADTEHAPDLTELSSNNATSEKFMNCFKGKDFNHKLPKILTHFVDFFLKT